jgi:hypothetical protein
MENFSDCKFGYKETVYFGYKGTASSNTAVVVIIRYGHFGYNGKM